MLLGNPLVLPACLAAAEGPPGLGMAPAAAAAAGKGSAAAAVVLGRGWGRVLAQLVALQQQVGRGLVHQWPGGRGLLLGGKGRGHPGQEGRELWGAARMVHGVDMARHASLLRTQRRH